MSSPREPVGLIAGQGRMPLLVARGVREAGHPLVVVGLRGYASERLAGQADAFAWRGLTRLGGWIRFFKAHGVGKAVMIGSVRKQAMFSPLRLVHNLPDWRSARLWYCLIRRDKRDDAVLRAVAEELASEGIQLVSSVEYCEEHLAGEGVLTKKAVPAAAAADVDFGWRIAVASADLDIGQAIAVKERDIIAVEAIEGTDEMIRRAGQLCPVGGWTMIKVARSRQDMRFDVPTVGPKTLRNLRDAGCGCLVVEAGKTLIVDKPVTLALADQLGIAVVGRQRCQAQQGQAAPD
jgi:DUF1009 family protein